jgi:hypothetical protein
MKYLAMICLGILFLILLWAFIGPAHKIERKDIDDEGNRNGYGGRNVQT